MVLIDSLHIIQSGGLVLLKYLMFQIRLTGIHADYLIDNRGRKYFEDNKDITAFYMDGSEAARYKFYKANKDRYKIVLCFANVPPPIRIPSKVYTLFHNIYFLKIPACVSLKEKLIFYLKRKYLFSKANNTDYFIVQTQYMRDLLSSKSKQPILVHPFYECGADKVGTNMKSNYVYAANYQNTKRQEKLIEAWKMLAEKGYFPTLHLTMGNAPDSVKEKIDIANKHGAKIINHGSLKRDEIFSLCSSSAATIYPSVGESFGLGIVEAMECGCDVIGPDLPYIHTICKPSSTFEVDNVLSIANAVIAYESGGCPRTVKLVKNEICEIIKLLTI